MFCKYCGKKISKDAKSCPHCGRETEETGHIKKMIQKKLKRINSWHLIYIIPIIIFIIFLIKINSIKGHWYLANADDFRRRSGDFYVYSGPSEEIFFNSNGSFSDSDNGSILGTYSAKDGILTLNYSNGETETCGYKVKWGKLYIYVGKKECVYARRIDEVEPESVLLTKILCIEDNGMFSIYNTDITSKTFITDKSASDPQYKYGIQVQLNEENKEIFETFTTDHLFHDIELDTVHINSRSLSINAIITDGKVIIAYFDNEEDARNYYNSVE